MAANVTPIYSATPKTNGINFTAALTKSDGSGTIGTDIFLAFSPGADGSFLSRVRVKAVASTAATGTLATVIRLYLSTQSSGATTNANTQCIGEMALPIMTIDQSTSATPEFDFELNFPIESTKFLLISTHVAAAANASFQAVVFGGNY